ncbi:MAG TPA: hypothetical protein VIG50_19205 [Vicinamibacteria bacterium]|jgi:hypothetical protein
MIHPPRCRAALLAALLAPGAAVAQEATAAPEQYRLRVEYREYRPSLTGEVQRGDGATAGTLLDLEDDFGITDHRQFEVHGAIQIRQGHKLRVSVTRLDYRAEAEARRNFTFGSTRFERFSDVHTNVKGFYYTAEYEWDFWKGPRGYLGVLLGAKAIDIDWTVVSPPSQRETDTTRGPVPSIGGAARLYAGRVSIDGELSGLSYGSLGTAIEAQTSVRVHLSDRLALQGGYRLLKIKGDNELDLGDARLGGFTFGLELSL